jgi:hypothetical protein
MASLWPWLAIAGVGALHGLNPGSGWMLAVAAGTRAANPWRALRSLLPIAVGHAASVGLVVVAVGYGLSVDRSALQIGAGGVLAAALAVRLAGRRHPRTRAPAGQLSVALFSFMSASAHGAGLMLVPALLPLCTAYAPALHGAASGAGTWSPLALTLMALALHTAAMLAVTGLVACGVCRGFDLAAGWWRRPRPTAPPDCPASGRSAR